MCNICAAPAMCLYAKEISRLVPFRAYEFGAAFFCTLHLLTGFFWVCVCVSHFVTFATRWHLVDLSSFQHTETTKEIRHSIPNYIPIGNGGYFFFISSQFNWKGIRRFYEILLHIDLNIDFNLDLILWFLFNWNRFTTTFIVYNEIGRICDNLFFVLWFQWNEWTKERLKQVDFDICYLIF